LINKKQVYIGSTVYIKSDRITDREYGTCRRMKKMIGRCYSVYKLTHDEKGVRLKHHSHTAVYNFRLEDLELHIDDTKQKSIKVCNPNCNSAMFDEKLLTV